MNDRALLDAIWELTRATHERTLRIESAVKTIMSNTDPLAGEISQVQGDLSALQTQNTNLIGLVQKLAAAAGVNTAADLAALQAADTSVTSITAADVAALAANPSGTPPATATQ